MPEPGKRVRDRSAGAVSEHSRAHHSTMKHLSSGARRSSGKQDDERRMDRSATWLPVAAIEGTTFGRRPWFGASPLQPALRAMHAISRAEHISAAWIKFQKTTLGDPAPAWLPVRAVIGLPLAAAPPCCRLTNNDAAYRRPMLAADLDACDAFATSAGQSRCWKVAIKHSAKQAWYCVRDSSRGN